jgi:hypothetical protein
MMFSYHKTISGGTVSRKIYDLVVAHCFCNIKIPHLRLISSLSLKCITVVILVVEAVVVMLSTLRSILTMDWVMS